MRCMTYENYTEFYRETILDKLVSTIYIYTNNTKIVSIENISIKRLYGT